MKRVAIVGGGITGLSAAYYLEKHRQSGIPLDYVLYEAGPRLGGSLLTEHIEGCVVEGGPDSFLTEKPWAAELCRDVGLGDQLIASNDAQRKTYILVDNRLIPIPDGLMFMVPTKILPTLTTRLFSFATKLQMAKEWFHPPRPAGQDESVAALVERHYGSEIVERLADPLLSGVYGGEAAKLSVRAVLPRFVDMESQHGSLGRAMLSTRKKMAHSKGTPRPLFTSLRNGMQQLVDALLKYIPDGRFRRNTPICGIQRTSTGWSLQNETGQTTEFEHLIVCTPANVAGTLLRPMDDQLGSNLEQVEYTSSVTVVLAFQKEKTQLPPGFGFLVPRSEGKRMLACTFVQNKFPHRTPPDKALLRCFLGGSRNEDILAMTEEQILTAAREELRQIFGLAAEPVFTRVYKWRGAMAQYAVGHLERLEQIEQRRQLLSGLSLAGNGYRGIGVPDCVRSGRQAANQAAGVTEVTPSISRTRDPLASQQVR